MIEHRRISTQYFNIINNQQQKQYLMVNEFVI